MFDDYKRIVVLCLFGLLLSVREYTQEMQYYISSSSFIIILQSIHFVPVNKKK